MVDPELLHTTKNPLLGFRSFGEKYLLGSSVSLHASPNSTARSP